jgi:uncharacterized protein YheU (UPF0270 family)
MAELLRIPPERLAPDTLVALLEEYASRDGTDYGLRELSLEEKVARLQSQLRSGELAIVYDASSEHWDLLDPQQMEQFEL